jgi:hypothetical protein
MNAERMMTAYPRHRLAQVGNAAHQQVIALPLQEAGREEVGSAWVPDASIVHIIDYGRQSVRRNTFGDCALRGLNTQFARTGVEARSADARGSGRHCAGVMRLGELQFAQERQHRSSAAP